MVPLGNISISATGSGLDTKNSVTVNKNKLGMYISKPQLLTCSDMMKSNAAGYIHPFFWVTSSKQTEDKKLVNMDMYIQQHKGYYFPVLYNTQRFLRIVSC